jgi:hypothetical protein
LTGRDDIQRITVHGGCVWGTFACAGFCVRRSVNPCTAATIPFDSGLEVAPSRTQSNVGYVRDLTIDGLMEDKPQLLWASHYLSALAKALLNDAELGMMKAP